MRYSNFNGVFRGLPSNVITGEVPAFTSQTSDVLMMTGASENHAFVSFNCLYSMVLADPYASYVYLNLGLSNETLSKLFSHFRTISQIQQKMGSTGIIGYRVFNWNSFPDWMSLEKRGPRDSAYSWKVISLVDVFNEWKAVLYWLDGGCVIREGISRELTMARHYGLYTAFSGGDVSQYTHMDMQHFMVKNRLLHHYIDGRKPMAMATAFVIDYSNATIRDTFIPIYLKCAYTEKCIVPRKSNEKNHRWDQSLLTLLVYDFNIPYCARPDRQYAVAIHTDELSNVANENALKNTLVKIKNTYNIYFTNDFYNIDGWKQTRETFHVVTRPIDNEWK